MKHEYIVIEKNDHIETNSQNDYGKYHLHKVTKQF